MATKVRVGFLFNHYFPHQVPHAAPYAFELSRRYGKALDVTVACATEEELRFAQKIASFYPGHKVRFLKLPVPWYYQVLDPFVSTWAFGRKTMVLRRNLEFFRTLDVLVAPERHCARLRTKFGLEDLIMIHTRHGAGDRKGGFDPKIKYFDFVLLPGQKPLDRLKELGLLEEGKYAVVGYPKFEVVEKLHPQRPRIFANNHVTVVYNPHFDQRVASWNKWGLKVLEFFAKHREYNLIFAPHVVLFRRRLRHRARRIPKRFYRCPNIHIDLGSMASVDMTYMLAADIYLGDVSSQVYEFIWKPRPCIYLNAHGVKWQGNPYYLHWTFGQVVEDFERDFARCLEKAFALQSLYEPKQREAFRYTFYDEPGTTAAQRGAAAIYQFLREHPRTKARLKD
ncbi:MAG TPA: hypothetical protein ENJ96_10105 [Thermodesulfatator atlanticus]|uniref:Uncharacterized protein n=1 Tax=Thermodesulfatator atlanticus TaxID=501497 RepID=A0A7V5P228_9BACT|nr:hypothetical protein [Thermodesulfatator atlanticus]